MNYKKYINLYNLKLNYLKDIENLKKLYNSKNINKKDYLNLFSIFINNLNNIDKLLLDYKYLSKKTKKIKVLN